MSERGTAGSASPTLYPLKFKEVIRPYPFGGRRIIEYFGKEGLPDGIVAETWEITEHGDDVSVVKNGPLTGTDLRTLVRTRGAEILGRRVAETSPNRFPLLLKFLDAKTTLGMQVHPDDDYAAVNEPGENGKTEAWYVIDADPGAFLYCGNKPGLTREALVAAIEDGNPERCMETVPVKPGDTVYVPAGRMHAIGKGILVYEPQQSCNTTYGPRARPGATPEQARERTRKFIEACHLEDLGEQVIPPVVLRYGANERRFLLASRFFATEMLKVSEPWTQHQDGEKFLAYSVLSGTGRIEYGDGQSESFKKGESLLMPAALREFTIVPNGECEIIYSYVPDVANDIVRPLREMGVAPKAIAALGGPGQANDVAPVVFGR